MRLAKINGVKIDIDDKTAIGLDLQSYDIKTPGKQFVNVTNSFTIPSTELNLALFGNPQSPYSLSRKIYDLSTFDYWVDNEQLISDARVRVEYIADRIGLFAFQKPTVWDELKLMLWPDFVSDFILWMQDNKGLPSITNKTTANFGDFLEPYTENTEGLLLPFYFGNLYNYELEEDSGAFEEDQYNIRLRSWPANYPKADGGHFCMYIKTIFEYIEYKFDVNFLTSGGQAIGNLWDDEFAQKIYIPLRDLVVMNNSIGTQFWFKYDEACIFLPEDDLKDKGDKTLHDCVLGFMQLFNVVKDDLLIDNSPAIRLARFDDIKAIAEVKSFSGNITGIVKYKPYIDGYGIKNTIKFSDVFENGDELLSSRTLNCGNLNLDATKELFSIGGYINPFLDIDGGRAADLSSADAFKTFSYLINDGLTDSIINIHTEESGNLQTATLRLQKAALYSLDGEYTLLDEILDTPKFYEIEKWLTFADIKDFEFFKLYYIQELGGAFFMNKIKGFNPQNSKRATKLELFKVSDRTPISPPDLNYWTDGVGDAWTDGSGDIYY